MRHRTRRAVLVTDTFTHPYTITPFCSLRTDRCGHGAYMQYRTCQRPPNEPPPEPPPPPSKPPPEKEPPEPPSHRNLEPPEDGAAMEIVLRTSAKLELSCAPKSPIIRTEHRRGGNTCRRHATAPVDAPITAARMQRHVHVRRSRHAHPTTEDRPLPDMLWSAAPSPCRKCRMRWHTPYIGPTMSYQARHGH